MDVRRHVTAGRLVGAVRRGRRSRPTSSSAPWAGAGSPSRSCALLEPETRAALEAYADGVNAYLDDRAARPSSPSSTPCSRAGGLDYQPEPWTPVDSLAWLKAMAWDLRGNMTDEIDRVLALGRPHAGAGRPALPGLPLRPERPDRRSRARSSTASSSRTPPAATRLPAAAGVRRRRAATLADRLRGRARARCRRCSAAATASAATPGWSTASTPRPARRCWPTTRTSASACRASGSRSACTAATVDADCPFDVAGLHVLRRAGRGHRPQRRHRLGLHQPRARRQRPLPRAGATATSGGTTAGCRPLRTRTETIEVRGGDDVDAHRPLDRATARCSPTSPTTCADGRRAGAGRPPGPAASDGVRRRAGVDRARARPRRPTRSSPSTRPPTGTSSGPRPPQFEVPAQNLVYADRDGHIGYQAPGRIPIRQSGNDGYLPARGLARRRRLDRRLRAVRGAAERARPRGGVRRHRQPGGRSDRDYPYYLTDDWDHGYRSQRIRDAARGRGRARRSTRWPSSSSTTATRSRRRWCRTCSTYELPRRLLRATGQELLRDWDFTQPADSAAAAYFNVVWRNLLELTFHDDLPEDVWPDGGDRWVRGHRASCSTGPANPWWDDVDHRRRGRDPRRHPAAGDAATPATSSPGCRRSTPTTGRGAGCTGSTSSNQTLGSPASAPVEWLFNRGPLARSAAAARSSTRRRGTPPRATTSPARRRCGWSCRSPTSTTPAGSTSPASPGTRSTTTTPTRPTSGPTARRCRGPFTRGRRRGRRPRTRSPSSRPADPG